MRWESATICCWVTYITLAEASLARTATPQGINLLRASATALKYVEGILMRVYSPFHVQGFREKSHPNQGSFRIIPLTVYLRPGSDSFSWFRPDPQPEPQRDLSDQFPGRVQVHGGPHSLPEASQVPGGYHLHREHRCYQGERHLFRHLHPALRSASRQKHFYSLWLKEISR